MSRIFNVKGSIFKYHLDIVPIHETASHAVHVRRRAVTGNTPLLTMHDGADETAAVIAVSHLPHFSKNFKIGLGDSKGPPDAMRWEDLLVFNSGVKHRWTFDVAARNNDEREVAETARPVTKRLCWTRTKHVTVDGMHKPKFSAQNYKLVEEHGDGDDSGEVAEEKDGKNIVAVFTSTSARGEIGKIQLNVDYGRDFDVMVWMTCLTIFWAGR